MPQYKVNFLMLIILDGWGIRKEKADNAIAQAHTPAIDALRQKYPCTCLAANGEDVGLPAGMMGNSEVGHLNLGAGRIVDQELVRISKSITSGAFFANGVLLQAVREVRRRNGALHLLGLLSDGGVHSHNSHLYALLELARQHGIARVYIHPLLDGRDTLPRSAGFFLRELEDKCREIGTGAVASIAGRYYAMDRDQRWSRTEKAYRAYVFGEGETAPDSGEALARAYARGETDEFVLPTVIKNAKSEPVALVRDADALVFFNFRADRARQLGYAFTVKEFSHFPRGERPPFPYFVTFTEYAANLADQVVFPAQDLRDTLGETVAVAGLRQLRIAETEKYAHVTYFFSGGREEAFWGEDRILIPSPPVATYDQKPEMSAVEVTARVLQEMEKNNHSLIVLNFANADMVGHTGLLPQAIRAVETVDRCVGAVVERVLAKGGIALVTADHGNAEQMRDGDSPYTAHTTNDTPFILVDPRHLYRLRERGRLADVAPTVLELLGLPVPAAMDGESLIVKHNPDQCNAAENKKHGTIRERAIQETRGKKRAR